MSDYFRSKERNFLDPSDPDFLKRKPTATPEAPKTLPPKGDLAPSSIFDEKPPGEQPDVVEPATSTLPTRDPLVLAAALDPNPVARQRWQRKMIIRDVRNRGQLTKAQQLKRTERESLCKSSFFKTSIKKLYPLARQIARKPIEEAIIQMRFSKKRVARDVKKHLEYARDEAIVKRGMGLGMVKPEESEAAENEESGVDTKLKSDHENKANWPGMVVEDKKGKRRFVNDTSSIYVDEAWVGRGTYRGILEYRARGRVNVLKCPETSKLSKVMKSMVRVARLIFMQASLCGSRKRQPGYDSWTSGSRKGRRRKSGLRFPIDLLLRRDSTASGKRTAHRTRYQLIEMLQLSRYYQQIVG